MALYSVCLVALFCVFALIQQNECQLFRPQPRPNSNSNAYPGYCTMNGVSYPVGSKWYGDGCTLVECSRQGNGIYDIVHHECGVITFSRPSNQCSIAQDNNQYYPKCCPYVKC